MSEISELLLFLNMLGGTGLYEYLKGTIKDYYDDKIVLECRDIGYLITVSSMTLKNLSQDSGQIKIYIHQHVREDEMTLYCFGDKQERKLFRDLISISGVGPKVSIGILSNFTFDKFTSYLSSGDEKAISTAPGIGKKTANRIILELRDKYKNIIAVQSDAGNIISADNLDVKKEAAQALESLGYTYSEGLEMVDKIFEEGMTIEDIIKKALSQSAFATS